LTLVLSLLAVPFAVEAQPAGKVHRVGKEMMSHPPAANKTSMTEAQIKQLIKSLANTFGHPIRSPILHWPEEYGLEYENVSFPSFDGVPLDA
jgi:hypothetical protein